MISIYFHGAELVVYNIHQPDGPFLLWDPLHLELGQNLPYFMISEVPANEGVLAQCLLHLHFLHLLLVVLVSGARLLIYARLVQPICHFLALWGKRVSASSAECAAVV